MELIKVNFVALCYFWRLLCGLLAIFRGDDFVKSCHNNFLFIQNNLCLFWSERLMHHQLLKMECFSRSQNHDFAIEDLRICQVAALPYIFWRWFTWWIFWDLRHFLAWRLWSSRAVIKLSQFRVTCLIFPSTPFLSLKA